MIFAHLQISTMHWMYHKVIQDFEMEALYILWVCFSVANNDFKIRDNVSDRFGILTIGAS